MGLLRRRSNEEWTVVAETNGIVEAEIIAGLLRTADIPYYIQQESVGRVIGISLGAIGRVSVLVPTKFEAVAMALLDEPTMDDFPPQLDEPTIM